MIEEGNHSADLQILPTVDSTEQVTLSLLVAVSENNAIGLDNQLPWHLPQDLKYFKNQTWALPILMGRKTFESIGKALPGRHNIVITRNSQWKHEDVHTVHSIEQAITKAKSFGTKEIFVIGGAEIFNTALAMAGRIYLTRVHATIEGDAFFPPINEPQWTLVSERFCAKDVKNVYDHSYQIWKAG